MIDEQTIHADMRRIFAPVAGVTLAPGLASPSREISSRELVAPSAPRRWRLLGKDGIAAAGFALAITGIGLVAAPLLTTPAPAPRTAVLRPAMPAVTPASATPPTVATLSPPPPAAAAPVALQAATPGTATPAKPTARTVAVRRVRPQRLRRTSVRRARVVRRKTTAGAALRRALARDVVITRRLNQEALRRLRGR